MSWNRHIRAETQKVALIGLLVLSAVGHRAHTAHREQRLTGKRKKVLLEPKLTSVYHSMIATVGKQYLKHCKC